MPALDNAPPPGPRSKIRAILPWALALAAGGLGTVRYHLAQFESRFDLFFGDRGDGRFITYICEHWYQALTGRANLLSPAFFYPVEGTLGYSDALVGYGLPYSLLRTCGLEMFTAMQVMIVVFDFLAFIACFVLLHRVLRLHALGSCAAALFFAFCSPKANQLGHLQLQLTLLLPLLFIFLILFARSVADQRRTSAFIYLALAVLTFHLQLLTTFLYAWFFVLWSLLWVGVSLLFPSLRRFLLDLVRRSWPAIAGGAGVALAGVLPFVAVYRPALRTTTGYAYPYVVPMIPAARNLLDPGPANQIWGRLSAAMQASPPPPYAGELRVGIGLLPTLAWIGLTVFAIAAVVRQRRPRAPVERGVPDGPLARRPDQLFLVATILATSLFVVLGTKYGEGGASPWRYVHDLVPGASAVRAVARYVIFLTLPMAMAFAWAIDHGMRWAAAKPRSVVALAAQAAIGVLAFAAVFEQLGSFRGFSKTSERAYLDELESGLPRDCEAFYLAAPRSAAASPAEHQCDAMMVSIRSGVPTLNGLSSRFPPGWRLLSTEPAVYEAGVREWIALRHIEGKVCRLEIVVPLEVIETSLPSAINEPRFFVRQQYLDLLGREPTAAETEQWVATIEHCRRGDISCDRIHAAQAIFRSPEFLGRGDFVFRLYRAAVHRPPTYREFEADLPHLGTLLRSASSEAEAKRVFARELVERAEIAEGAEVVDRADALLDLAEREAHTGIDARTLLTLHYFAYLRRDPGPAFEARLARFEADADTRELTAGLLRSPEYRARVAP